jgi:hypothetical protein
MLPYNGLTGSYSRPEVGFEELGDLRENCAESMSMNFWKSPFIYLFEALPPERCSLLDCAASK